MNKPPKRDYDRWKSPHFDWASVETFIAEDRWSDGIHTVHFPSAPSVDIMLVGEPLAGARDSIPVFFSGAVQDRQDKSGPFFSGRNISLGGGFPYVAISDPSLELDEKLGLAWYAGSQDQDLPRHLGAILTRFAEVSERELLLVGGSGGGYAAIFYGQCLGELASVLVWNAQTDILEYNEKFVKKYLLAAFPRDTFHHLESPDWKQEIRKVMASDAVDLSVLERAKRGQRPRRCIFIQNATDWHVPVHAAPFAEASQYKHRGRGLHAADENHALWISHYGADHAPLSAAAVTFLTKELLDPKRTALDILSSFRESGLVPDQQPGLEPRDLRHLKEVIEDQLSLGLSVHDNEIVAEVVLGDIPSGYGGLRFGFFNVTPEGKASNIKWYSSETDCRLTRRNEVDNDTIQVRVRDGFNNDLFSLEQRILPSGPTRRKRFFIYGSCVTRDAFALNHEFELVDYIARSPISSAFASPPTKIHVAFESIPSEFQRRMVRTDVQKDLSRLLCEASYDFLLIDLIDERLQVMQFGDSVITYSAEIQKTGITADSSALTSVGSEEFYHRWEAGFGRLLSLCSPDKIIINKVFWATTDDTGAELPNQDYIAANNAILTRLYKHIGLTDGIQFIEIPSHLLVADSKHKWGPAPYHFAEEASIHLLRELARQRTWNSEATDQARVVS